MAWHGTPYHTIPYHTIHNMAPVAAAALLLAEIHAPSPCPPRHVGKPASEHAADLRDEASLICMHRTCRHFLPYEGAIRTKPPVCAVLCRLPPAPVDTVCCPCSVRCCTTVFGVPPHLRCCYDAIHPNRHVRFRLAGQSRPCIPLALIATTVCPRASLQAPRQQSLLRSHARQPL